MLYMFMSMGTYVCKLMYGHVPLMSEVDVECHLQSLSALFFESCVLFLDFFVVVVFPLGLGLINSDRLATDILESTNPLPLIPHPLFRL